MSEEPSNTAKYTRAWQRVPEEEKRALLGAAKAKGLEGCVLLCVLGASAAFGLKMPAILLGTAVLLPLLYQAIAAKDWRENRPRLLAKYMVAGHTAAQYAASMRSSDPALNVIFRGNLTPPLKLLAQRYPDLEPEEVQTHPIPVWVSLFPDHLIMISESDNGAKLEFAHSTLDKFHLISDEGGDESEETRDTIAIETEVPDGESERWILRSPHTSAIRACEKKIRLYNERARTQQEQAHQHLTIGR